MAVLALPTHVSARAMPTLSCTPMPAGCSRTRGQLSGFGSALVLCHLCFPEEELCYRVPNARVTLLSAELPDEALWHGKVTRTGWPGTAKVLSGSHDSGSTT